MHIQRTLCVVDGRMEFLNEKNHRFLDKIYEKGGSNRIEFNIRQIEWNNIFYFVKIAGEMNVKCMKSLKNEFFLERAQK